MGDVSYINKVLEQFKEAVELITRALEIDEKCEFVYETLGTRPATISDRRCLQFIMTVSISVIVPPPILVLDKYRYYNNMQCNYCKHDAFYY